jgi:hypothetical protein
MLHHRFLLFALLSSTLACGLFGCNQSSTSETNVSADSAADSDTANTVAASDAPDANDDASTSDGSALQLESAAGNSSPDQATADMDEEVEGGNLFAAYEVDAESLLAAALPQERLDEGWVKLFDGQSPFGWFLTGDANWSIDGDALRVSKGDSSYLCTSFQLADYELQIDFRCDPNTNTGIFLRTGPEPGNVAEGCLELNIAPPDNPFPTGSFVQRKKLEPEQLNELTGGQEFDPTQWHTYRVRLEGSEVEVFLDGKSILKLSDFVSNPTGHISLQHNQGRVEFRNIMLRPIQGKSLKLDEEWQDDWTKSVKEDASMEVEVVEDGLKLTGGLGQIQSTDDFGDFILQAAYTLAKPEVNSGIFFRCIRDNMLDGYECQVNHAIEENDPLVPGDAGAGAIFRRQPARIVVGDGTSKTYLTILANGPQIMTWVNGLAVADFYDSREPNENPRRGLRTEAGPISIQAHDPTTEVVYHELRVTELE